MNLMEEHGVGYSKKGLVAQMREGDNTHQEGEVKVVLAKSYGFCWGVERAVQMAYEARRRFPDERLHITNEIIHNPSVNGRLKEMGVNFIQETEEGKDFSGVGKGDVVILPAFGASVHEMKLMDDRGANIVDTTCPWVSKVWNAVANYDKKNYTSVVHGKWQHEETVATASFAGIYLIVKNEAEAQYVIDYIHNGGDKTEFMAKFKNAVSENFDPDVDLQSIGMANQTTMLKGETEMLGKLFEKAMMEKYGPENLKEHFIVLDTICDATQERQDAMYELVEEKVDIMIVAGGFNSSNTSHLQEISELAKVDSFWVDTAERIDVANNSLDWRTSWGELRTTKDWLKPGALTVGVTSGASTPDKVVEDVLDAIFEIKAGLA